MSRPHIHKKKKPDTRLPSAFPLLSGCLLGVVLTTAVPMHAHARGLSAPVVGDGRSSAERVHPSAVYWNPGALGGIEKPTLSLGANLILGSIRYQRNYRGIYQREDSFAFQTPIANQDIDPTKTGWAPNSNIAVVGPQPDFFLAIPIKDTGLVIGAGVAAPYVATAHFPTDGAQRFALQDALIAVAELTVSAAYRINEHVSVGAGLSGVVGYADITRVTDFAAQDLLGDALEGPPVYQSNDFGLNAPTGVRELDVLARPTYLESMLGIGATFNLGVMLDFEPIHIGLSYHHSTRMNFRGTFLLDMDNDFFTQDLAAQGLQFPAHIRGDASLSLTLPNSIKFGMRYDVSDQIGLALGVVWDRWSTVKSFDVVLLSDDLAQPELGIPRTASVQLNRQWKNTIGIDGFIDYKLDEKIAFYGHAGFLQNAVPDETIDASSPDANLVILGAGIHIDFPGRLDLMLDATVHHTLPREVRSSAYDIGNGTYGLTLFNLGAHLGIQLGKLDNARADASSDAIDEDDTMHADAQPQDHDEQLNADTTEAPAPQNASDSVDDEDDFSDFGDFEEFEDFE